MPRLALLLVFLAGSSLQAQSTLETQTLQLPTVYDAVWDAQHARMFVSSGTQLLIINPENASIDKQVVTGQTAQRLALSSDGQYLYASVRTLGVVRRYLAATMTLDAEINLGKNANGQNYAIGALASIPGKPQSFIAARGDFYYNDLQTVTSNDIVVYDGTVKRRDALALKVSSLYIRNSEIHAFGRGGLYRLSANNPNSLTVDRTIPLSLFFSNPRWRDDFVVSDNGIVVNLVSGTVLGATPVDPNNKAYDDFVSILATNPSGTAVYAITGKQNLSVPASFNAYDLENFRLSSRSAFNISPVLTRASGARVVPWGTNGFVISAFDSDTVSSFGMFRVPELAPVTAPQRPQPFVNSSGLRTLAVPAAGLIYDQARNRVWATVGDHNSEIANSVISIDPATAAIDAIIPGGSSPARLAMATDSSRLFVSSKSAPLVSVIDPDARKRTSIFSVLDDNYWEVKSIVAMPQQPGSVILSRYRTDDYHAYLTSAAIYDDGHPRRLTVDNDRGPDTFPTTNIYQADRPEYFYGVDMYQHYGDGSRVMQRLIASADGVKLDKRLSPLLMSPFDDRTNLAYSNGHLFAGGGYDVSPDTTILNGIFTPPPDSAGLGVPIPFPARNWIVYVHDPNGIPAISIFDANTHQLIGSKTLDLGAYTDRMKDAVRTGPSSLAIAANGQIAFLSLADIPSLPNQPITLTTVAPGLQKLSIKATSLAAIPGSNSLAITTSGSLGPNGNSIIVYDPFNARVDKTIYVGSEPDTMAVSPDGSAIYTVLKGESMIARANLRFGTRDLLFGADPYGASRQFLASDMVVLPDGGLVASISNFGAVAVFDEGRPRPVFDLNESGQFAYNPSDMQLTMGDGNILYGKNTFLSTYDLRRYEVTKDGVRQLSAIGNLPVGYDNFVHYSNGLLYAEYGEIIDGERSQLVGKLSYPGHTQLYNTTVDAPNNRAYAADSHEVYMFDLSTRNVIGRTTINFGSDYLPRMFRFGSDGLAFLTYTNDVYILRISSIPLLPTPIGPSQYIYPVTEGVRILPIIAEDLAWDASRGWLYASLPHRAAAAGDKIAIIDVNSGQIGWTFPTGVNPRVLSLSDDNSKLYFSEGLLPNFLYHTFSFTSEGVRSVEIATGNMSPMFGLFPATDTTSVEVRDLQAVPGNPQSVAVIHENEGLDPLTETQTLKMSHGTGGPRIYDGTIARAKYPTASACRMMTAGADPSRLYCNFDDSFKKLSIDPTGVTVATTTKLSKVTSGDLVQSNGRIYTSGGLIFDAETGKELASLDVFGDVAVDGNRMHWLQRGGGTFDQPTFTIQTYDATTFKKISSRTIGVTPLVDSNVNLDNGRLLAISNGRLVFRANREIYIVDPVLTAPPSITPGGVVPAGGLTSVLQPGSWISIYGDNLAPAVVNWTGAFPTNLGGTTVTIGGKPAYLSYVSPTQINAQVPDGIPAGATTLTVAHTKGSASATVQIAAVAPALIPFDARYPAAIIPGAAGKYEFLGPAGRFSFPTRPVRSGEIIELYGVGFGPTEPSVPSGRIFTGSAPTTSTPIVTIGGSRAEVLYSGMTGAGLYQFNIKVPTLPSGDQQVRISIAGVDAPPVYIPVQ